MDADRGSLKLCLMNENDEPLCFPPLQQSADRGGELQKLADLNGDRAPVPPTEAELLYKQLLSIPGGGVGGGFSSVCIISPNGLGSFMFPDAIAVACANAMPLDKFPAVGFVGDSSTGDFNKPT